MEVLKAISSTPEVLTKISQSKTLGKIIGVYDRALNFRLIDGSIIGVIEMTAGNCPGNIVISSFSSINLEIDAGTNVYVYPSFLRIGGVLIISLENIKLWNPKVRLQSNLSHPSIIENKVIKIIEKTMKESEVGLGNLIPYVFQISRGFYFSSPNSVWARIFAPHLVGICQGLIEGDRKKIKEKFSQIIGMGPGLTPSGDDILVGLFGSLYPILCSFGQDPPSLPIWPSLDWIRGTTWLGDSLVYHSLRGELAQLVQRVILGILTEKVDFEISLLKLLGMGASSGHDTLLGILLGILVGLEIKKERIN